MELLIQVASQEEAMALFGPGDRHLKRIKETCGVRITARNGVVRLSSDDRVALERAASVLERMISMHRAGVRVPPGYVDEALACPGQAPDPGGGEGPQWESAGEPAAELAGGAGSGGALEAALSAGGEEGTAQGGAPALAEKEEAVVQGLARSAGQEVYLRALLRHEIVFCIGPAGTGKTYLAVRMAVNALREGQVRRLILCRPAVEAGEKLGFLPGDFQAKVNPYLRPLYDALNDILGFDQVKRYLERDIIEILPLAYMRGRTLNHAFIILDEGQNTTIAQMKMFLTRMGMYSRIVVNGDVTQVDLPPGQPSGLIHAEKVIRNIRGIAWVRLAKADIVRHPLVKRIVDAYEAEARSRP